MTRCHLCGRGRAGRSVPLHEDIQGDDAHFDHDAPGEVPRRDGHEHEQYDGFGVEERYVILTD